MVHRSVWQFLSIECKESPLLPRLHSLCALGLRPNDLPVFFLLLSPSLCSLSFSYESDASYNSTTSDVTGMALHYIAQTAPQIKFLRLPSLPYLRGSHFSSLEGFAGLTELSLGGSSFPHKGTKLCQLATRSTLNALTIAIPHLRSTDLQSLSDGFQSLHTLTIRGKLKRLVKFIRACRLPSLDDLTVQPDDRIDSGELRSRLSAICQHPGLPRSLTRIGCEICGYRLTFVYLPGTLMEYFEPLLAFPCVEYCRLILGDMPFISDEDLLRFGDAWGKLEYLDIRRRDGTELKPRVLALATLSGLLELARRCPALEHVHLPELDARTLPEKDVSRLGHPLRELSFDSVRYAKDTSPASSSQRSCAIADVLDLAFPMLNAPLSVSEGSRACDDLQKQVVDSDWKDILEFLQETQMSRDPLAAGASARRPANLDFDSEDSESDEDSSDGGPRARSRSSSDPDSSSSSDSESE